MKHVYVFDSIEPQTSYMRRVSEDRSMSKIASFNFSGVRLSGRGSAIALTTLLLSAAAIAAMSSPVDVDSSTDKDDECVTIPGRRSPFCGETSFKEFAYVANSFPGSISGYKVDTNTGALRPIPGKIFVSGKRGGGSLGRPTPNTGFCTLQIHRMRTTTSLDSKSMRRTAG